MSKTAFYTDINHHGVPGQAGWDHKTNINDVLDAKRNGSRLSNTHLATRLPMRLEM